MSDISKELEEVMLVDEEAGTITIIPELEEIPVDMVSVEGSSPS